MNSLKKFLLRGDIYGRTEKRQVESSKIQKEKRKDALERILTSFKEEVSLQKES